MRKEKDAGEQVVNEGMHRIAPVLLAHLRAQGEEGAATADRFVSRVSFQLQTMGAKIATQTLREFIMDNLPAPNTRSMEWAQTFGEYRPNWPLFLRHLRNELRGVATDHRMLCALGVVSGILTVKPWTDSYCWPHGWLEILVDEIIWQPPTLYILGLEAIPFGEHTFDLQFTVARGVVEITNASFEPPRTTEFNQKLLDLFAIAEENLTEVLAQDEA